MINQNKYTKLKNQIKAKIEEITNKNKRIYIDQIPDKSSIPKIEKLIKAVKTQCPVKSELNNRTILILLIIVLLLKTF